MSKTTFTTIDAVIIEALILNATKDMAREKRTLATVNMPSHDQARCIHTISRLEGYLAACRDLRDALTPTPTPVTDGGPVAQPTPASKHTPDYPKTTHICVTCFKDSGKYYTSDEAYELPEPMYLFEIIPHMRKLIADRKIPGLIDGAFFSYVLIEGEHIPPHLLITPTDGEPDTVEGDYNNPNTPERRMGNQDYGSHDGFDHPLQSDLDR